MRLRDDYGLVYGIQSNTPQYTEYKLEASQTFENASGKYVKIDTGNNNYLAIAGSGDALLYGWVRTAAVTSSSTAGISRLPVDVNPASLYIIPTDATPSAANVGKTCDLIKSGDTQQADVGESNEDVIKLMAVDTTNNIALVRMSLVALDGTGVV